MKLSVNIGNLLDRFPFEKSAELYRDAGFDAIDLGLGDMVSDAAARRGEDYRAVAAQLRATADRLGIPFNQTHAPAISSPKLIQNPDSYKEIVLPETIRSLEFSALLGAKVVVVHPLHFMTYFGHEEELFELNMEFYRALIPYCREYGICVGVENMWQMHPTRNMISHDTCSRKEEFIRYIDTLDSEYMVACLDLGHAAISQPSDDEPEDVILALGHDRLKALHVHDNNYKDDSHDVPFIGRLNWAAITSALGKIDYTGDFTYETTLKFMRGADDGFVPFGLKYMERVGRYLIGCVEAVRNA